MAKRHRRMARVVVEDGDPEEDVLLDEDEELLDEEEAEVKKHRKSQVAQPPRPRRRIKVEEPDEDDDDEEEEEISPRRQLSSKRKSVAVPDDDDESEGDEEFILRSIDDLAKVLAAGQSLTLTRTKGGYAVSIGAAVQAIGKKLKGREYYLEVTTEEYREFDAEWSAMTFAEKKAMATKANARWQQHDDPQVEMMRIKPAVVKALNIKKWKDRYDTRRARNALRG